MNLRNPNDWEVADTGSQKIITEDQIRIRELVDQVRSLKARLATAQLALKMSDEDLERLRDVTIELGRLLEQEKVHASS